MPERALMFLVYVIAFLVLVILLFKVLERV
jgi:hypothetical protein